MRRALAALCLALAVAVPCAAYAAAQAEPAAGPTEPGAAPQAPAVEAPRSQPAEKASEEEHTLKPINLFDFGNKEQPPYAYALINFSALMALFYFAGKKPMTQALKNRRQNVAKDIEEAQRMKREAEERAKQYQARLAHLGDELDATKRALEEAGKGERERIVKEAEEKAGRMQKDAAFLLEQEAKQLRLDLVQETADMAVAAAEELLKKRVTEADQERFAEEFLRSLEARGGGARP